MATHNHTDFDDHLTDIGRIVGLMGSMSHRYLTMLLLARMLDQEARIIFKDSHHYRSVTLSEKLDGAAGIVAEFSTAIHFSPASGAVMKAAVRLAKAACVTRGESSDLVPSGDSILARGIAKLG